MALATTLEKPRVFHKTIVRLTAFYLAIIMAISLFFSLNLYTISSNEIRRGIARQTQAFDRRPFNPLLDDFRDDLQAQREAIIDEANDQLIFRLFLTNLFIFVGGGILSYALARRTLRPIQEAHEAQSRFVADASHELRTPITAMKTESEVALGDPKLTAAQAKKQLASNIEELDKLTALTDGLLRLARLDNNGHKVKSVAVDSLAQDSIGKVLPLAEAKKILINPSMPENITVQGDKHLLSEMLITILENAIKYSPNKSEILVSAIKSKQHIKIAITDHGKGIRATDIPHIFDRFYRADSSRTRSSTNGYGLGLAIAQNIAELHGGDISVKSAPGKGSTFTVSLPTS